MPPRNATPPTGPRGSRGPSRGGIAKRSSTPRPRVDKDGDLIMGAAAGVDNKPSGKGRPEGNRLPRGGRTGGRGGQVPSGAARLATAQGQQAILRGMRSQQANILESRITQGDGSTASRKELMDIRVHGLKESKAASNADGGLKDLLGFLERKASALNGAPARGIRIKKSRKQADNVIITTNEVDGEWILKLHDFKFAGATLAIERIDDKAAASAFKSGESMSEEAKATQEKIRGILSTRYDVDLKLLNLSALGQDPGLLEMGMFGAQNRISKMFPVLMVVCDKLFTSAQQKRDAIVSVTLTDNELDSISNVTMLAQTFPDIQNLDLSRNKFSEIRQLEGWRWKFRKLHNLRLLENPIDSSPTYKTDLLKWYPQLQILNDIQVRSPAEIEAAAQAKKAAKVSPIPIAGPDFRDVNGIGENFVRQFFPLYDSDRGSLASSLYDADSVHSISVNVSAPRSEDQAKTTHSWSAYIRQSRNLLKITTPAARQSRTFKGVEAIKGLWIDLPPTRHPNLSTETSKYLVDCHPTSGLPDPTGQNLRGVDGMVLMIHGQFDEAPPNSSEIITRSFSRTFILGPGAPGGPTIRVVSDIMVLRAYSPLASAATEEGAEPNAPGQMDENVQKQQILEELMKRTNMTAEYANMCLAEANWELEKALVVFEANKARLPPTAFLNNIAAMA